MSKLTFSWIILVSLISIFQPSTAAADYNVIHFGAKPDGKTESTQAFLGAWTSACNSRSTVATVYVPRGRYVVKPIKLTGPCRGKIIFKIDGTIVAPASYDSMGSSEFWILFYKVDWLSVHGGTFDATGAAYWSCRKSGKSCPTATKSISFEECNNVVVNGLRSINSRYFHIAIDDCNNIMLQKLTITAPNWSPNTDGIHIQSSSGVTISETAIKTGDDCISIGPGSRNIYIHNVACGPGHGISIGSLGNFKTEEGVQNITVTDSVFTRTQNGLRIKTWGRSICNGFARNILYQNCVMNNVFNPIIIDQNYCPNNQCPHQNSGVQVSGVTYRNIKGTSATKVAMSFGCSPSKPCSGIKLQDIKLAYSNKATTSTTSYCKNAKGSSSGVVVPDSCF